MSRSLLLSVVFMAAIIAAPPAVLGQDQPVPEVPNSKFHFAGVINAAAVNVRSGPGENYYATIRLDKGTPVTVVGHQFEWLKIIPPQGSFSLISKQYVQLDADGRTGTVTGDNCRVRAGSGLVNVISTVQCKLNKGDRVTVAGDYDESFYRVLPPDGTFLYVHQKFIDPVRKLAEGEAPARPTTLPSEIASVVPTTRPTEVEATGPATRPSNATAEAFAAAQAEFERLENLAKSSSNADLGEQPLPELLEGYQKLATSEQAPVSIRRVAEIRVAILKVRNDAREELLASRKRSAEIEAKLEAIRAQRAVAENKLQGTGIFTAVGSLKASTLRGDDTIFRLVDPATERTICYVRSTDKNFVRLMDQFIGVNGELTDDAQLGRLVKVTSFASVDPAKVNKGVSARVIPPSLLSGGSDSTATTGNQ